MIGTGVVTFAACLLLNAPYGRYSASQGWGSLIHAQIAWFFMESPNLWITVLVYCVLREEGTDKLAPNVCNQILLLFFCAHYVHRSLIYPFRMRNKENAPMPFSVMILAFAFCTWNGAQQALALCCAYSYDDAWLTDPRFVGGMILAVFGMCVNIHSDSILLSLSLRNKMNKNKRQTRSSTRGMAGTGATSKYVIPRGGMFEYVSAANYTGEIMEWAGFAVACWSLPALAFALYTFSNIGPRGFNHHKWYKREFGVSYPDHRKAVIPFIW